MFRVFQFGISYAMFSLPLLSETDMRRSQLSFVASQASALDRQFLVASDPDRYALEIILAEMQLSFFAARELPSPALAVPVLPHRGCVWPQPRRAGSARRNHSRPR